MDRQSELPKGLSEFYEYTPAGGGKRQKIARNKLPEFVQKGITGSEQRINPTTRLPDPCNVFVDNQGNTYYLDAAQKQPGTPAFRTREAIKKAREKKAQSQPAEIVNQEDKKKAVEAEPAKKGGGIKTALALTAGAVALAAALNYSPDQNKPGSESADQPPKTPPVPTLISTNQPIPTASSTPTNPPPKASPTSTFSLTKEPTKTIVSVTIGKDNISTAWSAVLKLTNNQVKYPFTLDIENKDGKTKKITVRSSKDLPLIVRPGDKLSIR